MKVNYNHNPEASSIAPAKVTSNMAKEIRLPYLNSTQIGCTGCESFCIFADPCCPILAESRLKGT